MAARCGAGKADLGCDLVHPTLAPVRERCLSPKWFLLGKLDDVVRLTSVEIVLELSTTRRVGNLQIIITYISARRWWRDVARGPRAGGNDSSIVRGDMANDPC